MPLIVDNQHAIRDARNAVRFCYICGSKLKENADGSLDSCRDEHVVPISMLRLGGVINEQERYPVILDVHDHCDETFKSRNDNIVSAYHAMHNIAKEQWGKNRPRQILPLVKEEMYDAWGRLLPVLDGKPVFDACRDWVRGMHALLYKSFLPLRPECFSIYPPSPAFNKTDPLGQSIEHQIQLWLNYRAFFDRVIDQANDANALDRIVAWGGELVYEAVWSDCVVKRFKKQMKATCFWNLRHPGIKAVAEDVEGGVPRWTGMYCYFDIPKGASTVDQFMCS